MKRFLGFSFIFLIASPLWGQGKGSPLHFDRVTAEVQVVRLVEPAVVSIQTNKLVEQGYYDLFGNWYRRNRGSRPFSQGSGVLIDPQGFLITNEHVVRGADQIKVKFTPKYDSKEYDAELISEDMESDLALLKIKREQPFPAVTMGHSSDLMIGEKVIAIGNPYGEQNTVTSGILSAIGRDVNIEGRAVKGLIQTDASINPGNSGGPLLNINGELIGINNAIHPLAEGIGFAIPVDRVREILNARLFNPDESKRIWAGIRFSNTEELRIQSVEENSPADKAGLENGDHIVWLNGKALESSVDFSKALLSANPGDRLRVKVRRGSDEKNFTLELRSHLEQLSTRMLGLILYEEKGNTQNRIFVSEVLSEGPADRIGIEKGDRLISFQYRQRDHFGFVRPKTMEVQSLEDVVVLLEAIQSNSTLGISIERKSEIYKGEISVR